MSTNEERDRRAKRWIWGCTGGCLGLIALLALVIFLTVRHLMHPVTVVPPATFLTGDTSAFLFARADPADPLSMAAAVDIFTRPPLLKLLPTKQGQPLDMDSERAREVLSDLAPLQLVFVTRPAEEEGQAYGALACSVRSGSKLLRLLAKSELEKQVQFREYDGAEIGQLAANAYVGLRTNNFMISDNAALLKDWVARLAQERQRQQQAGAGAAPSAPIPKIAPALRRAYDRLDARLPLVFACLNSHGELTALAKRIKDPKAREFLDVTRITSTDVLSLAGQFKPLNSTDAELSLFVECADVDAAGGVRDALQTLVEQSDKWPLESTQVSVQDGSVVLLRGTVNDLPKKIGDMVVAAFERLQKARPGAATQEAAPPQPVTPPSP